MLSGTMEASPFRSVLAQRSLLPVSQVQVSSTTGAYFSYPRGTSRAIAIVFSVLGLS